MALYPKDVSMLGNSSVLTVPAPVSSRPATELERTLVEHTLCSYPFCHTEQMLDGMRQFHAEITVSSLVFREQQGLWPEDGCKLEQILPTVTVPYGQPIQQGVEGKPEPALPQSRASPAQCNLCCKCNN